MTIENTQCKHDPNFPTVNNAIKAGNVTRLPEPIERYVNLSLGQNGCNNAAFSSADDVSCVAAKFSLPISITTLGQFKLEGQKQDLGISCKGQHKPIEMLKALIALGGKDVGEIRLCEALWPDTDGDIAHSAFSVTLHRLRKLTGHDALELNDSRLTLNAKYCWVDVWACEHLLNICNRIMSNKHVDKQYAMRCIESAMNLYNGPFLGNEDEQPWYIMFRQRLHSKMLRGLLNISAYLEDNNSCDQALDLYHKGIELEPLAEEFYFRLMRCLASLDRKAEAILIYIRCQKILQATIGVTPSRATHTLYTKLLN